MAGERQLVSRMGHPLGMKGAASATNVPAGAVFFMRNLRSGDRGILKTRPGTALVAPFLGNGRTHLMTSAFDTLVEVWDDDIYKLAAGAWAPLRENWVTVDMAERFDRIRWTDAGDEVLYLFTGHGLWRTIATGCAEVVPTEPAGGTPSNLLRADDGSQSLDSVIAKSTVATMKHGLQLRAACAYGNRVYLSAPSDPKYWPNNQEIVLPEDGSRVVALAVWYDVLVIFRDTDVWAFIGTDVTDVSAKLVRQATIGCVSRDTVVDVPGWGLTYLGPDNVYTLEGLQAISDRVRAVPVGSDIQPQLKQALSESTLQDVCAAFHDGEYRLSVPDYTGADKVFVMQVMSDAVSWGMDTGPASAYLTVLNGQLHSGLAEGGAVVRHDDSILTDCGAPVSIEVYFGQEKLPTTAKITRMFLVLQGQETQQNLRVSMVVDGRELSVAAFTVSGQFGADMAIGSGVLGTGRLGRVAELRAYEGRVSLKGQYIQVSISGGTGLEKIAIAGYVLEVRPKSKMRGQRQGVTKVWPLNL